jgi:tRNA threonylcarbamoyladenosine biosynthesis protein TsaE
MEIITKNAGETQELGKKIGDSLRRKLKKNKKSILLALSGDLGSGKTTMTQGLAVGLGIKARVLSPTFIIMREYLKKTAPSLYHIDLYRFPDQAVAGIEVDSLGISDLWTQEGNVIVIEWPEKAKEKLPQDTLWIQIENLEGDVRKVSLPEGLV